MADKTFVDTGIFDMRAPVGRDQLDTLSCPCGQEHDFQFSPACHPGMPVFGYYDKATGVLKLECAVCGEVTIKISVADVGIGKIHMVDAVAPTDGAGDDTPTH